MPASGTANEVAGSKSEGDDERGAGRRRLRRAEQAGSASGLRNSPCRAAPERPSVAPISSASSVRGRRMSRTMMPAGAVAVEQAGERRARRQPGRPDHQRDDRQHDDQRRKRRIEPQASVRRACMSILRRLSYRLPACGATELRPIIRMDGSMRVRTCETDCPLQSARGCAGALAARAARREPTPPPQRVVSFNLCADQLVLALADPDADRRAVALCRRSGACRSWPTRRAHSASSTGRPKSMIPLKPDLVLVGTWDRSVTQRMLRVAGLPRGRGRRSSATSQPARRADPRDGGAARPSGARRGADRGARARARAARGGAAADGVDARWWSSAAAIRRARRASPRRCWREAGLQAAAGRARGLSAASFRWKSCRCCGPIVLRDGSLLESRDGQGAMYLMHPALRELYPPERRIVLPTRYTCAAARPGRGVRLSGAMSMARAAVAELHAARCPFAR